MIPEGNPAVKAGRGLSRLAEDQPQSKPQTSSGQKRLFYASRFIRVVPSQGPRRQRPTCDTTTEQAPNMNWQRIVYTSGFARVILVQAGAMLIFSVSFQFEGKIPWMGLKQNSSSAGSMGRVSLVLHAENTGQHARHPFTYLW